MPTIAMCGAFFWARISKRTPAIFFPAITTSFGSLTLTGNEDSLETVSAIALVAQRSKRGESPRSILGRSKNENQRPWRTADSHELSR